MTATRPTASIRHLLWLTAFVSPLALAGDPQLDAEAKQLIAPFAQQLQATVKQAMQAGGPVAAIEACQLMAPQIASQHSKAPWQVGRTSLKVRNPDNAADDWERNVLTRFAEQVAAGKPLAELSYGEQVGREYRYMQAIATGEPCLACHGQTLKPEVKAALAAKYPQDQATGFALGDLRGAFSLRKILE